MSTPALDRAGRLRSALEAEGLRVELVTPSEEIADREDGGLLILTGGTAPEAPAPLLLQARERAELPVIAVLEAGAVEEPHAPGIEEIFPETAPPSEIGLIARRLVERHRLQEITGIVGESDAIREALERVVQIAPVQSTVLINGESGTGKELIARGIHALSPRKHRPFIAVNVAALSDTLLESELFGHEKGAFTGAVDSRRGLFELADKGTIFLDEIGEMPLATQTKLLRVLEEREFARVGGEKMIEVDVRIIGATNQELRRLVQLGDFRKDLYYRLNVLRIELPPLRERPEDIPRLVHHFVREITERNGRPFYGISPEGMQLLREHRWPGNVRELRNLVESMVVLAPGREIRPSDIPDEVRSPGRGGDLLPAPIPRAEDAGGGGASREQMEFIFRTLVDLRMDVDDLRKEFDRYQRQIEEPRWPAAEIGGPVRSVEPVPPPSPAIDGPIWEVDAESGVALPIPPTGAEPGAEGRPAGAPGAEVDEGAVVYRPGMTMEEMEREAIVAALREVDGNRRKAAELLGIGERTLYRKIRKFELED